MSTATELIRVEADFNSGTIHNYPWILIHNGRSLDEQLNELNLSVGDSVLLFADDGDLTVPAKLAMEFAEDLGREVLCAIPDWDQLVLKQLPTGGQQEP